jgi:hypothetical protein
MTQLDTPPVPALSDLRVSVRQQHLVREIAAQPRRRRTGRLAISGGALVAAAVTAILVLAFAGPGTPDAFAAWTPAPTPPAPGQVASAEGACATAAAAPPPGAPLGLAPATPPVSLVDTRGPFTLVLFGSNTATRGALMCVSGPTITPNAKHSTHMSQSHTRQSIGRQPPSPTPGQITLDRLQAESADNGQPYTIAEGSTGSDVTAVTLTLNDGTHVRATTGHRLVLAWWPGTAHVTSATLTTSTETTTQPITSPARDTGTDN